MILYTQLYCIIFKIKSLFSKYSIAVYTRFVEFTIDRCADGGYRWPRVRGSGTRTSVPRVPRYIRIAYFLRLGYTAVFFILKSSIGPLRRTNFILRHFTFFSTEVFIQPTFTTAHVSTAATCHCMFLCGGDMPPHATKYGCKTGVQKNCGGIMQPRLRTAEVICHRTCQSAIALYHWTVHAWRVVAPQMELFEVSRKGRLKF